MSLPVSRDRVGDCPHLPPNHSHTEIKPSHPKSGFLGRNGECQGWRKPSPLPPPPPPALPKEKRKLRNLAGGHAGNREEPVLEKQIFPCQDKRCFSTLFFFSPFSTPIPENLGIWAFPKGCLGVFWFAGSSWEGKKSKIQMMEFSPGKKKSFKFFLGV